MVTKETGEFIQLSLGLLSLVGLVMTVYVYWQVRKMTPGSKEYDDSWFRIKFVWAPMLIVAPIVSAVLEYSDKDTMPNAFRIIFKK